MHFYVLLVEVEHNYDIKGSSSYVHMMIQYTSALTNHIFFLS